MPYKCDVVVVGVSKQTVGPGDQLPEENYDSLVQDLNATFVVGEYVVARIGDEYTVAEVAP